MPHIKRIPIETDINIIIQLTTYLGYGILTVLGYFRDWIDLLFGWRELTPRGYAPITRDFEEFFRRRLYGRIIDCFNRPITGPACGIIKCLKRKFPSNGECNLCEDVYESLINNHEFNKHEYNECLNLSSYNYLGFGQPGHPLCEKNVLFTLLKYGCSTSTAPLYGGNTLLHKNLENTICKYLNVEDAMIFGMGWGVNATAIPALIGCDKGSLIISDSINHNSIVTGARTSGAKIKTFPHDNMNKLESIIRKSIIEGQPRTHRPWKKILIIIEGVYSMEGEICDLESIIRIKKKYKCYLYLDEAHSIGAVGKTGRGVTEYYNINPNDIDILMGTFTKSFGSIGGYIAGKHKLIKSCKLICASQIFSSGLSPPCVSQILSAFKIIDSDEGEKRIKQLHNNSDLMRYELNKAGLYVIGDKGSAVIPMLVCNPGKLAMTSRLLLKTGIAVVIVGFPAVPILFSRIRFCISANHTKQQILNAVQKIKQVAQITHLYYKRKLLG